MNILLYDLLSENMAQHNEERREKLEREVAKMGNGSKKNGIALSNIRKIGHFIASVITS